MRITCDTLVIGSGIAGLSFALEAAAHGDVILVTKRSRDESITKWDIFYYAYGLLHHPAYRERYADNLKRELPRIPFVPTPQPPPRTRRGGARRARI